MKEKGRSREGKGEESWFYGTKRKPFPVVSFLNFRTFYFFVSFSIFDFWLLVMFCFVFTCSFLFSLSLSLTHTHTRSPISFLYVYKGALKC